MALLDWKYPNPVPGIQTFPGPEFFRGGYEYSNRVEGNSYNYWTPKDVKTFLLADHLITPETGYNFQTEWFPILEYPNGYKVLFKIDVDTQPYTFIQWKTVDENGDPIPNDTPISYQGSLSTPGAINLPVMEVKTALFTYYPVDQTLLVPVDGAEPTEFAYNWFIGGTGALNLNPYVQTKECITFRPLDELHADFKGGISLANIADINNYLNTHGNPIPTDYPFILEQDLPQDYDPSQPGGGDGNYDDKSDPIDFPDLPTGGALASGAIHAFHVSTVILTQLFQKLWSTSVFDMATWQKLVASPLDCIVSLHAIPCAPIEGADANIYFGNFNTGLSAKTISSQYVAVDCGTITLTKFFGSAMDFSPYTKISLYCPFSGIHDLATEDVQGAAIHVKYLIDILTGDCSIQVKCGQSVLYKFTGNMKMQIPVTSRDDNALGNTIKGSVGMIAGSIIGGAVGAGAAGLAVSTLSAAANVATHKVTVSHSGEITGNVGILDDFVPYLIIHRPQQSLARDYNKFKGYPSNLTLTLGSCTGYTEVEHIHLTGINGATDTELTEIEDLLKNGVII